MIKAINIRNKTERKKIPNDKPGLYTWWAEESDYSLLLNKLEINKSSIDQYVKRNGSLVCIYVGMTAQPLRSRLDSHVNRHSRASIFNYGLSTLRRSIASVVTGNLYDKKGTDEFINRLYIEFKTFDYPLKAKKTKEDIEKIETEFMKTNLCILNLKDNNHEKAADIILKLTTMRSNAMIKARKEAHKA